MPPRYQTRVAARVRAKLVALARMAMAWTRARICVLGCRERHSATAPFKEAPMSGTIAMAKRSGVIAASSFHQPEMVGVDGLMVAKQSQQNGQSHGRFTSGKRHNENSHHLPVEGARVAGETDKREINAIEHDFDRHQQDEHVLANENADPPNGKKRGTEKQEVGKRNPRISS